MNVSLRRLLILATTIWCLAIVAAPIYNLTPVYVVFAAICHQLPARSWHIHGEPLAACIRCTAIYYGFLAGLLTLSRPNARWFTIAAGITAAEWLLAFFYFRQRCPASTIGNPGRCKRSAHRSYWFGRDVHQESEDST